jgi:hypothetical protein
LATRTTETLKLTEQQWRIAMRYRPHLDLMRLSVMTLIVLASTACVGAPRIVALGNACSDLIPADWRNGVPGAPLPVRKTDGAWIAFADAQTGQLDKANGRTVDTIGIVERCEQRNRAAVDRASKKWWQVWK